MTALEKLIKLGLCVVVVALFGCNREKPAPPLEEIPSKTFKFQSTWTVLTEFSKDGHVYLLASATYANSMIHAEHCPCKLRPLNVNTVVTNVAWRTNWITQVSDELLEKVVNQLKDKK